MILGVAALAMTGPMFTVISAAQDTSNRSNKFGVGLAKRVALESNKNVLVSPASLYVAFGGLYAGSRGKTKATLEKAFGYATTNTAANLEGLSDLNSGIKREGVVTVANSLWSAPSFSPLATYENLVSDKFGMEAKRLTNLGSQGVAQINGWVNTNTKGLIPKLLDSIDRSTVLILMNAITFEGKWVSPFKSKDTVVQTFHGGGAGTPVKFMKQRGSFDYAKVGSVQYVKMPYKSGLSMVIGLPATGTDPSAILNSFQKPLAFSASAVNLQIPKFKFSASYELVKTLSGLGLAPIFTGADLTGISPELNAHRAKVNQVIQKTIVDVDEEGTKAAALTSIGVTRLSMPVFRNQVDFVADHPFAFSIQDDKTGAILFLGLVRHLDSI